MLPQQVSIRRVYRLILLLFCCCAPFAAAQEQKESRKPLQQPGPKATPPQDSENDVIRMNTRVVFIDALVKDRKKKAPITNLTRENFTVLDDGHVRELTYFTTGMETRRPRLLMLVIDFKGHWGRTFHNKEAVTRLSAALAKLPPEDEIAIAVSWIGKADSPCSPPNPDSRYDPPPLRILQEFTRDRQKIAAALGSVPELSEQYERDYKQIDWSYDLAKTVSGIACAADALHRAAPERPNSQPVMVVAADDLTYFPFTVRDEIVRRSLEAGATVNLLRTRTFFLTNWAADMAKRTDFKGMPGTVEVVAEIAKQTGGEMAGVGGAKDYIEEFEKMIAGMTARYTLGFTLGDDDERDVGRLHKLEIRVNARDERGKERKVEVRARSGYYLPKK